jgi:hypothetical protein
MGMDQPVGNYREYLVANLCIYLPGIRIPQLPGFAFTDAIQIG